MYIICAYRIVKNQFSSKHISLVIKNEIDSQAFLEPQITKFNKHIASLIIFHEICRPHT